MTNPADHITVDSLREQTVWRLLTGLPHGPFSVADLSSFSAGVADLHWSLTNLRSESLGDATVITAGVRTDRIVLGNAPAFWAALIVPGSPDELLLLVELRGGYSLGAGDYLEFDLTVIL